MELNNVNLDPIIESIIKFLIIPGIIYLATVIRKLAAAKIEEWMNKTNLAKKEDLRAAIAAASDELSSAAYKATMETQETFVNGLKKEGRFTAEQWKEAFNLSFNRTKEIMSNAGLSILDQATGALDARIKAEIHALLPSVKAESGAITKRSNSIGFSIPATCEIIEEAEAEEEI